MMDEKKLIKDTFFMLLRLTPTSMSQTRMFYEIEDRFDKDKKEYVDIQWSKYPDTNPISKFYEPFSDDKWDWSVPTAEECVKEGPLRFTMYVSGMHYTVDLTESEKLDVQMQILGIAKAYQHKKLSYIKDRANVLSNPCDAFGGSLTENVKQTDLPFSEKDVIPEDKWL